MSEDDRVNNSPFAFVIRPPEHDLMMVVKSSSELDALTMLMKRMAKGREKYPLGCTVASLLDEAGEFTHAVNKEEGRFRMREELLDIAAVAMRLYLGEVDTDYGAVEAAHDALKNDR